MGRPCSQARSSYEHEEDAPAAHRGCCVASYDDPLVCRRCCSAAALPHLGWQVRSLFQCQLHLIAIKLLGPLTKLSTLKLLQQMSKLIILLRQSAALRN